MPVVVVRARRPVDKCATVCRHPQTGRVRGSVQPERFEHRDWFDESDQSRSPLRSAGPSDSNSKLTTPSHEKRRGRGEEEEEEEEEEGMIAAFCERGTLHEYIPVSFAAAMTTGRVENAVATI